MAQEQAKSPSGTAATGAKDKSHNPLEAMTRSREEKPGSASSGERNPDLPKRTSLAERLQAEQRKRGRQRRRNAKSRQRRRKKRLRSRLWNSPSLKPRARARVRGTAAAIRSHAAPQGRHRAGFPPPTTIFLRSAGSSSLSSSGRRARPSWSRSAHRSPGS